MIHLVRFVCDDGPVYVDPNRITSITPDTKGQKATLVCWDEGSDTLGYVRLDDDPDEVVRQIERAVPGAKSFHLG